MILEEYSVISQAWIGCKTYEVEDALNLDEQFNGGIKRAVTSQSSFMLERNKTIWYTNGNIHTDRKFLGIYLGSRGEVKNKASLCHEIGHGILPALEDKIENEIQAWELGYSIFCMEFKPTAKERKTFFDYMVDCLESYGW